MPREPLHTFRASSALWDAAMEVAHDKGENLSEVLRRALEAYAQRGVEEGRGLVREQGQEEQRADAL